MISENFKNKLRFIFYSLFFVFFSCNESDSIILNPPNPNTFQTKSFMLDSELSISTRLSDFNAGNSPRSYVGFVDENTESSLFVKIDKEIVSANEVCDEEAPTFKDFKLNLILKKSLVDLGYNLSDMTTLSSSESQPISSEIYNGDNDCAGPIVDWVYSGDIEENECLSYNLDLLPAGLSNQWSIPTSVTIEDVETGESNVYTESCGELTEVTQCCKYMDCIACCDDAQNEENDDDVFNENQDDIFTAYILDDSSSGISNYEETSYSNHQTEWLSDAIIQELEVTIEEPFWISINLYDYLLNQGLQNFCDLSSDIMILLRLNYLSSSVYEPYVEIFSTDDSSPSYNYKPSVSITYDELTDVRQEQRKYSIDNENINFNTAINSNDISYYIHNTDSIRIVAFSNSQDYSNEEDCSCQMIDEMTDCTLCDNCTWNQDTCFYIVESITPDISPIIEAGYSDELFNFDITIDDAYLNLINLKDTLNDIIKFRFNEHYFIFNDTDPSNDDWYDYGSDGCPDILEDGYGGCLSLQEDSIYDSTENPDPNGDNLTTNDEGTQGNGIFDEGEGTEGNLHFDEGEEFDDYGLDFCSDQYEDGQGNCGNIDAVFNIDGGENNNIYDEGEYFDRDLDRGSDGCFSMYEDGNGYCLCNQNVEGDCDGIELVYNNCDDEDFDGICDDSNPIEYYNPDPNGDDFSLDPSGDNWNDCGFDGICPKVFDYRTNSLIDNPDWIEADPGEGNDEWDLGEGLEDNFRYDNGEYWIDAGVDQLFDIHEPGYDPILNPDPHGDNYHWTDNPDGTELSYEYEEGEWYFDDGPDQRDNHNEYNLGYDEDGKENNNQYDSGEEFSQWDIGSDICPNEYEIGEGACLCNLTIEGDCDGVTPNDLENNPDPNKDDYNIDPNNDNTIENNGDWDFLDYGADNCPDEYEDGAQGCLCDVTIEGDCDDITPNDLDIVSDPHGDNFDAESFPEGTEGNQKLDYNFDSVSKNTFWESGLGEKFETFYDNGDGNEVSANEENYLGNYASHSVTDLFYIYPINDLDVSESFDGDKTNHPDKNVFLWIDSITKTSEYQYNVSVHLETFVDLIAFQIDLDHDYFEYTEELIEEKTRGLWAYEDNINNEGEKYILDASIYDFDESFCTFIDGGCVSDDDLLLSYGHGMKSNLVFKDSEGQYFHEFIESLKNSTQFTIFSDEYTKLLLYFDLSEGSLHNVDEFTEIKIEYFDEEEMKYEIFPIYYQSVIVNQEYIAIPIVYFMQSYLVGDLNIFEDSTLDILLSASSEKFNFSKIAIDPEKSRIEVFYSE